MHEKKPAALFRAKTPKRTSPKAATNMTGKIDKPIDFFYGRCYNDILYEEWDKGYTMYYITLDLEWNQAYAQKAMAVQKQLSCRLRGEVIQIGAVKLDEQMRICGSYSVIIKPKYFRHIHRQVEKLTGISQEQMDRGLPLAEAAEGFRRFCGESFVFLTWGPDDIPMLKDNFRIHGLSSAWLDATYDMQIMFNRQTDGASKQRSLEYAMEHFDIAMTLPAHDALNDAYFTALVAQKLDIAKGMREYDATQGQYLHADVIGDADGGDDGYVTVADLLADPSAVAPPCPVCQGTMTPIDRPLHSRGQRYTFMYNCKKDGRICLSLKLQQNLNGTFRARRNMTVATDEDIEAFKKKLEESVIRRRARPRRRPRRKTGSPATGTSECRTAD